MTVCVASLFAATLVLVWTSPVAAEDGTAIEWESLLHGTGLDGWAETGLPWVPGEWKRSEDAITGNLTVEKNASITHGDSDWSDYELSVFGTLEEGSNLQILFRISEDGKSFYALDCGFGTALSIRQAGTIAHLSRVRKFPFEKGREYHIVIQARGSSLACFFDGQLVNQVIDDRLGKGGVGFNMWHETTARFRDPKIRHFR